MKPVGSKCEHEKERNDDLMRTYIRCVNNSESVIRLPLIMDRVVNSPSRRFWVSEERAGIVISQMMKGNRLEKMNEMKREMFFEIYRRVLKMRELYPTMPTQEIIFAVVHQPAPKFYLTVGSANVIIHRIKKKWFEERKRKLRHLF